MSNLPSPQSAGSSNHMARRTRSERVIGTWKLHTQRSLKTKKNHCVGRRKSIIVEEKIDTKGVSSSSSGSNEHEGSTESGGNSVSGEEEVCDTLTSGGLNKLLVHALPNLF